MTATLAPSSTSTLLTSMNLPLRPISAQEHATSTHRWKRHTHRSHHQQQQQQQQQRAAKFPKPVDRFIHLPGVTNWASMFRGRPVEWSDWRYLQHRQILTDWYAAKQRNRKKKTKRKGPSSSPAPPPSLHSHHLPPQTGPLRMLVGRRFHFFCFGGLSFAWVSAGYESLDPSRRTLEAALVD